MRTIVNIKKVGNLGGELRPVSLRTSMIFFHVKLKRFLICTCSSERISSRLQLLKLTFDLPPSTNYRPVSTVSNDLEAA